MPSDSSTTYRDLRPATSQTRSSPGFPIEPDALARVLPSGENATHQMSPRWPFRVKRGFRAGVGVGQSLTVPSPLAVARLLPSGEKLTPLIGPVCPERSVLRRPVDTSQTDSRPFSRPDARD